MKKRFSFAGSEAAGAAAKEREHEAAVAEQQREQGLAAHPPDHSWDDIAALLDGRRDAVQGDLFERPKPVPEWREIVTLMEEKYGHTNRVWVTDRGMSSEENIAFLEWAGKTHGAYVLRTNTDCENPAELWRWYIQLTEAESAFRDLKSDLALRPVYHHLQRRVEAHILVCFLSLCLWRTLEHWMGVGGPGDEARQFLLEMRQIHSMDIHLPTRQGPTVKLRVVSRPEKELAVLLSRMKLRLPNVPLKLEM